MKNEYKKQANYRVQKAKHSRVLRKFSVVRAHNGEAINVIDNKHAAEIEYILNLVCICVRN